MLTPWLQEEFWKFRGEKHQKRKNIVFRESLETLAWPIPRVPNCLQFSPLECSNVHRSHRFQTRQRYAGWSVYVINYELAGKRCVFANVTAYTTHLTWRNSRRADFISMLVLRAFLPLCVSQEWRSVCTLPSPPSPLAHRHELGGFPCVLLLLLCFICLNGLKGKPRKSTLSLSYFQTYVTTFYMLVTIQHQNVSVEFRFNFFKT